MAIYTCNTLQGHWPVGTAAVVSATSAEHAATLLNKHLKTIGLEQNPLVRDTEMDLFEDVPPEVRILCDGDY